MYFRDLCETLATYEKKVENGLYFGNKRVYLNCIENLKTAIKKSSLDKLIS